MVSSEDACKKGGVQRVAAADGRGEAVATTAAAASATGEAVQEEYNFPVIVQK